MRHFTDYSLKAFNTFGIDVFSSEFADFETVEEFCVFVKSGALKEKRFLIVGEGSNLLFLNDYNGLVLHSRIKNLTFDLDEKNESVFVEAGSGVNWDEFVAFCVEKGFWGPENLSLIPGDTGAAAVQNIGAYGVEICDIIQQVKVVDLTDGTLVDIDVAACGYGYRQSNFKTSWKEKYMVVSVVFKLSLKPKPALGYQHLELSVLKNGSISLANIRNTIIEIRQSKLPDPKETGNAGSFFMNPVISKEKFIQLQAVYPAIPHYFISETAEKVPAAWLIEQTGWKGKSLGNAGVHHLQPLVLINKGGATGAEIVALAQNIQQDVFEKFGIKLVPEVNYIS
jgi:UDP-N-acetylmuramate dehydrogenase